MTAPSGTTATTVAAARRALGPVGVSMPVSFTTAVPVDEQRAAVRGLESAGYAAAWTNEVIGKDAFALLSVLLSATGRMAFGTCVANVWARAPQTAHGAAALLAQAYPGRFALGLGVGYPQQAQSVGREFGRPLATVREYLARMDEPTSPPAPDVRYPRVLAANGPKMLALAAEVADGALPAGLPPEHTAQARAVLGPDKLLVVAQSVVLDDDRDRARATARQNVAGWAARAPFRTALRELGHPVDAAAGPSDRVVDLLVAHEGPDAAAAHVRAHLDAGADHVVLLQPIGTEFARGVAGWVRIAPAMTALG